MSSLSLQDANKNKEQIPSCHGDIRRWGHGCYTLIHDTDPEGAEFALDALLYIGGKGEDTAASFPVVFGDIGCDVTCRAIALTSKPLPPI